jgi:hypothetical protein
MTPQERKAKAAKSKSDFLKEIDEINAWILSECNKVKEQGSKQISECHNAYKGKY